MSGNGRAGGGLLVVEDDPAARAILELALKRLGLRVVAADSGPDALERLAREPFCCLLVDAKMSPMDGFELSLKARALRPGLRIAMLSAVCTDADIDGYPIERLFHKPASPEDLAGWARTCRSRQGAG